MEFKKLYINKLINIPTDINNSKEKVYKLDVDDLKIVFVDLKKIKWYSR